MLNFVLLLGLAQIRSTFYVRPRMVDYAEVMKVIARVLDLVDPARPYGTELFNALARVTISVAVEAVCLRRNPTNEVIEVLLFQRSPHDTAYPNQWHCPGSVMRKMESEDDVLERLSESEFGAKIVSNAFTGRHNNPHEVRGHFLSLVYLCAIEGDTKGAWFPVDQLPRDTVSHHRNSIIPIAVEYFEKSNPSA